MIAQVYEQYERNLKAYNAVVAEEDLPFDAWRTF